MGVSGWKVERPEQLGQALRSAFNLGKPAVVEVAIEKVI
jgi:thiamine pyrophosphate-dependent acetolactate synthase large subunit-like protein